MRSRRDFLGMIASGVLLGPAEMAFAGPTSPPPIVGRWVTGNRRSTPATLVGDGLLFAGESRIGSLNLRQPGAFHWQMPLDSPGAVFRPRCDGDVVVCGSGQALSAWDRRDGRRLWTYTAEVQTGVPTLAEGILFFGDGHRIVALEAATGRHLWHFAGVADTLASYAPLHVDGMVFAGPGDGRLYALSSREGRLVWQSDRMAEWQYLRQLHFGGGVVVAGSYKELLYGIDPRNGAVLWRFNAGNFINSHHVAGDVAYLWSPTGWIYAIDARTGGQRWRHRTTDYGANSGNWGPLMAELTTADGRLYALAMDNVLHVLDIETGRETNRSAISLPLRPFVVPEPDGSVLVGTNGGEILRLTVV